MFTTLFRVTKYGFQGLWRNPWLAVATILVMIIALLLFEGLVIFNFMTGKTVAALEDKIDIAVYFKSTAAEDDILDLERSLEVLAEVKSVEYVSRAKALEIFRRSNKDDSTIQQALEELGENPLLASLNIKAHDPNDYASIDTYLQNARLADIVEKVTFTESRLAIERLTALTNTAERMGLIFMLFLTLTAALVTFNTIRLAIYSNREEIGVMRLVGGSNSFINGPYIVQGMFLGAGAAILSTVIAIPFIEFVSPYVASFIPEINLKEYFSSNLANLLGYQLIFGVFLGAVSSGIAVRRYLKI